MAAEVAQAHARSQEASLRLKLAEKGIQLAVESTDKNFIAFSQVKRVGEVNQMVVRPLEVIASLQTLAQSYVDYYTALADYNRSQFQLYRALGYPAQYLDNPAGLCETFSPISAAAAETAPPAPPSLPVQEQLPLPAPVPSPMANPQMSAPSSVPVDPEVNWTRSSNPSYP